VCPACESPEFRTLFAAGDRLGRTSPRVFHVVECARCRLMRLHPRPGGEELRGSTPGDPWFAAGPSLAERWGEAVRRLVLCDQVSFVRRAVKECGESGPVLEVSSGSGTFVQMLRQEGVAVLSLHPAVEGASWCWRRGGAPSMCGRLEEAPVRPESCAAVTLFHILEHLPDPHAYVVSAGRLLRPAGRLIVAVPNAACWQFLLLGENWSGLDVPRHLLDFRARDLETLLDTCGFQVLRRKYFSLCDNAAGFATSLAPWLDPAVRRVRNLAESPGKKLLKDLAYLALAVGALPFTVVEAACQAGSTFLVEACKKP
jgi:SAM-dependent methyltransferase